MILYGIELVGGPFDGARGLQWRADDVYDAPPQAIFVASCRGLGECGMQFCRGRRRHVAYWAEKVAAPIETCHYEKADEWVNRDEDTHEAVQGTARYVLAELDLPDARHEEALAGVGDGVGDRLDFGPMVWE